MKKTFLDVLKLLLPLSRNKKDKIDAVSQYLDEEAVREIKHWLKMDKMDVQTHYMGSKALDTEEEYPQVKIIGEDPDIKIEELVEEWNEAIENHVKEALFNRFSLNAGTKILQLIAPNILGLDEVKEAALLQLFSKERVHILLLGDPGTGKTDILSSVHDLAPISSYGLGSGTSGAGLTVTVKGNEVVNGLLPNAHEGICCIDELNLMKNTDRAGLLNAMEKGFVSYDKGNKHLQVDADVRVLATANPEGDQFAGWMVDTLKKQIPFDPALLSRFHLVFLVRRPDVEGFVEISKKILSDEDDEKIDPDAVEFVKDYIEHVNDLEVKFDKKLEKRVTEFVEEVKENEDKYLIDVSPRLVVGIMRMAKASARIGMRKKVSVDDLENVLTLVRKSLDIGKKEESDSEKEEKE